MKKGVAIQAITSMLCITVLMIVALVNDINGVLLAGGVALLAGLGGYAVKTVKDKVSWHGKTT